MRKKVKCFDFFLGYLLEVSYLSNWKGALECIELGLAFCEEEVNVPQTLETFSGDWKQCPPLL